jgi:uncharacterized membrane protein YphA (DoxX/SURF4 family)
MLYVKFSRLVNYLQDPLFLFMRLFWGFKILRAGLLKLSDIDATSDQFLAMGLGLPVVMAITIGLIELVGGVGIFLGFFTRFWAFLLAIIMGVAYFFAHPEVIKAFSERSLLEALDAFTQPYHFLYFFPMLIIMATGPGRLSIDWFRMRKKSPLNAMTMC